VGITTLMGKPHSARLAITKPTLGQLRGTLKRGGRSNSAMTSQNSQNRKHGTSTNRSPVQALTPSEIQSLREDLKQSVIQARKIIADIMAKRSA